MFRWLIGNEEVSLKGVKRNMVQVEIMTEARE